MDRHAGPQSFISACLTNGNFMLRSINFEAIVPPGIVLPATFAGYQKDFSLSVGKQLF